LRSMATSIVADDGDNAPGEQKIPDNQIFLPNL
jgi:hypothetical protein